MKEELKKEDNNKYNNNNKNNDFKLRLERITKRDYKLNNDLYLKEISFKQENLANINDNITFMDKQNKNKITIAPTTPNSSQMIEKTKSV